MNRKGEKMFRLCFLFTVVFFISITKTILAAESILVFAGAASKPPTEETAKAFEKKTGIKVEIIFGGSGFVCRK